MKKVLLILLACSFFNSCGSSADERLVAKIDNLFSSKEQKTFGASKNFSSPMGYAVGQYVVTGTTDSDDERSISRIYIAGKSGKGWIFEFYSLNQESESFMQICMTGIEVASRTGNMDAVEIIWIKTRNEKGEVEKIEGALLNMMKAVYKMAIVSLQVNTSNIQNGGKISVPAGLFNATKMVKGESTFLGRTYQSTSWYHSSVPINGMVKSITDDGEIRTELLDFGFKGTETFF